MRPKKTALLTATAALISSVVAAQANPEFEKAFGAFTDAMRSECAAFENGTLDVFEDGIQYVADFDGDGRTDPIVDSGVFNCSSSATLFGGGSGGRAIHVFMAQPDDTYRRYEFLAQGSVTVSLGKTVILLLAKHGSECGLTGDQPCFAAYSWDGEGFVSAGGQIGPAE